MKIIGSDYDGTLNHGGIDDVKRNAIKKWRDAGNVFALISGRGPDDVIRIYNEKQFGCDYLIANNGAIILKPDGTVVSDTRCNGAVTVPLLKLLFENGCPWGNVQTAFPCRVYADENDCAEEGGYTLKNMPTVEYFNQISTILPDFETAEKVTELIRERFGNELNPLQNGICIDIVRSDMNKAKGLYILMDILGAEYDDIIAVGDNINDRAMIEEFRSYAMENGVDAIKELADYTVSSVTELIEKEI
ncbi:MAG: HAD hydrolase family protein [Acutalibacteraceae bacterium]|nr:HAD hydrolase family protein [Acutalibacteraceae bacterium]